VHRFRFLGVPLVTANRAPLFSYLSKEQEDCTRPLTYKSRAICDFCLFFPERSRILSGMVTKRKKPNGAKKNPAAVMLGRLGGLKGGHARAAKMTAEERSESARKAVLARWAKAKRQSKPRAA
jgi:hypothetical protein